MHGAMNVKEIAVAMLPKNDCVEDLEVQDRVVNIKLCLRLQTESLLLGRELVQTTKSAASSIEILILLIRKKNPL
jgi:hypothetical protein